jgi:hypothetical protein
MRVSVVPVALAGFVVAIVPTGGREMRPLPLTAGPPTPSLALVWKKDDGVRLAHLDARKMRVGKARSPQLDYVDAWTFDPDHRLLAFTSNPTQWGVWPDVLRFVQPSTLRFTPARTTLAAPARALLWARPDRIVAVEVDCCDAPQIVVETIDVAIGSVVSTQRLDVRVVRRPRAASDSVEPHRRRDAACRSVVLDRVVAGTSPSDDTSGEVFTTVRHPALVVDRAGDHAYVVQPDGPAADVDLETLAVSYHDLQAPSSALRRLSAWLTPSAEAKGWWDGPSRYGVWLGDGLIAITGGNATMRHDANGNVDVTDEPSGLTIVDTRDWSVQMVDPGADWALVSAHLLLATGGTYGNDVQSGMGLAAYKSDRSLKFRLFGHALVSVETAVAGRAYVLPAGLSTVSVVDLRTGRVIGHRRDATMPVPLSDASYGY